MENFSPREKANRQVDLCGNAVNVPRSSEKRLVVVRILDLFKYNVQLLLIPEILQRHDHSLGTELRQGLWGILFPNCVTFCFLPNLII